MPCCCAPLLSLPTAGAALQLSTVLGAAIPEERHEGKYIEGIAIWVAIFLVTFVSEWQRCKRFKNIVVVLVAGFYALLDSGMTHCAQQCFYLIGGSVPVRFCAAAGPCETHG
jgi:hypothetical protein